MSTASCLHPDAVMPKITEVLPKAGGQTRALGGPGMPQAAPGSKKKPKSLCSAWFPNVKLVPGTCDEESGCCRAESRTTAVTSKK